MNQSAGSRASGFPDLAVQDRGEKRAADIEKARQKDDALRGAFVAVQFARRRASIQRRFNPHHELPMSTRKHPAASTQALNQDEIPTVRPAAQSGWQKHPAVSVTAPHQPPTDGLWQLVCDVMRAEADEALWGTRR